MSALVVDYGMESSFRQAIQKAKTELNKRVDDYENIENRVKSIPSNTNNCSNCAYYVRKKYQQLQEKINKLNALNNKVESFVENVKETDKRVASRIKKDTQTFTKRTGIGKTGKSIWASICEGIGNAFEWIGETISAGVDWIKQIYEDIKQFYEDNKYWINIVADIVIVVAAVAACIGTGGLALAVGIFFAVDAVCDLIYDGAAAYQYYVKGNEAEAERLAGKGGKDAFMWVGRQVDNLMGWDFVEGTMGVIYTGLSIAAIGYTFYKQGEKILKALKLDKIKLKSPIKFQGGKIKFRSPVHGNFKLKSHFTWDKIRKVFGIKKVQQKDVFKLGAVIRNVIKTDVVTSRKYAKTILNIVYQVNIINKPRKFISNIYDAVNGANDALKDYYRQTELIWSGGA